MDEKRLTELVRSSGCNAKLPPGDLHEVLDSLPAADRELIRLRFYAGRTQSETARLLHTTQVQVSRRERKILGQMRAKLLESS